MTNCPYCLEGIKAGARKCPHCQSSLGTAPEASDATVYILDQGLIRFAKFSAALLGIFILVGVYVFGHNIKDASIKASEASTKASEARDKAFRASLDMEKALLKTEKQKSTLYKTIDDIKESIRRIETLEREIADHRDETSKSAEKVKKLVIEIRGYRDEAGKLLVEFRSLKPEEESVALAKREALGIEVDRGKLWKNGSTLRFRFLDGGDDVKAIVRRAINQWAEHVNLTFRETASGEAEIRISFEGDGSWSLIGTDALGIGKRDPTINYGFLSKHMDQDASMQNAMHEFGHALGLAHEFQNPSAGEVFDRAAVKDFLGGAPNFWSQETIESSLLSKAEYPGSRAYDPKSIMNNSFPRHLFVQGKETQPGKGLSESDKAYVASLYPRG